MPAKIDLKKLFAVAVSLKVFFAVISLLLASPYLFGLALPLTVMGLYIWLGATKRDTTVSDEKFADSCYYLGFIFTIASIIASLFDLQNIGTGLSDVAARFGAAMVSTCAGVIVRVILVSFRPDPESVMQSAEDLVLSSYRRLSDEFSRSFDQLVVFRGEAAEASRVAVSSVKEQIDSMAEMQRQQTETFFKEMTELNKATILSLIQDIRTASMGLNQILEQYQAKASETSEGIDQTLKNFIKTLVDRLNAIEFPQDIFSSRLAAPIAQLNDTTTDATVSVKQVSENVKSAAKSVSSSVEKINIQAESISEVLSVAQRLSTEQQELLFAIKRQQQSVIDQLQAYQEEMLQTMAAQQGAMLGELGEHSKLVSEINAIMIKLVNSLGENRETAGDFRQAWLNITRVAGDMGDVVKGSMEILTPAIVSLEAMTKQSASEARAATTSLGSLGDLMMQLIELNKTQLDQGATTSGQLQGIADINGQMHTLNENLMQIVLNNAQPVTGRSVDAEAFMEAVQTIAHSSESQSSVSTG
ncbi:hypothetical protein PS914_05735 [Pseudomonas fluorescens]|jgi:methyl-accepting chemotaxis protein|uniref:hypothetical protein n=1 Tax=Pseudomonas fluorescens TaxID=294 RepID=UPI0012416B9E|nr:hypothetical protein [Pseudomonas fluorescens]VVQ15452.1 hypothetical protein PS914_05735 [Pseudomonas fluorescens]